MIASQLYIYMYYHRHETMSITKLIEEQSAIKKLTQNYYTQVILIKQEAHF